MNGQEERKAHIKRAGRKILLRCTLDGSEPQPIPEGLSMERVLDIGIFHDVANVAFPAVRRLPVLPEESLSDRWQRSMRGR